MDPQGSTDRFPLHSSREPNPLRPYYVPPSIGPAQANLAGNSTQAARASTAASASSYGRDYLPDIDIDVRGATGEAWSNAKDLLDALAWRYVSVLLAQPFDVAKTVLQVSLPPTTSAAAPAAQSSRTVRRKSPTRRHRKHHVIQSSERVPSRYDGFASEVGSSAGQSEESEEGYSSGGSEGMPDYFTSSAPLSRSSSPRRRKRRSPSIPSSTRSSLELSPRGSRSKHSLQPEEPMYKLRMKRLDSVTHAISEVHRTSGALGLWRASNATFLYSILLRTTDSFLRSILLAILGLPEVDLPAQTGLSSGMSAVTGVDLSDSLSPLTSLFVIGASSCLTGLLLAPLDIIRTRLILTPTHLAPRGVWHTLKTLPSLVVPSAVALPTALYHGIPSVFSSSIPLFLRRYARISPELTPSLWSIATFTSTLAELFVRLPLETVLRRSQAQHIEDTHANLPTIVELAPHRGIAATVHGIIYAEGETTTKDPKTGMLRTRRGQGVAGLVRGWRVGFWGLVGVWAAGSLGGTGGSGRGEF